MTEAGRSFLNEARALIRHFDEVREYGRRVAQGRAGTLSIGFGFSTVTLVPRVISRFRKLNSRVQINLQDLSSGEHLNRLQAGNLDIGFVRLPVDAKFEQQIVLEDQLVLALPKSFAHVDKTPNLSDFKDQSFIIYSRKRSEFIYDHVFRVCAAYNFHPRIIQDAFELPTMLALVAAGLGIALVSGSQLRVKFAGVIHRRLANPVVNWQVGVVWRREKNQPLVEAFLKVLAEETKCFHTTF